MAANLLLVDDDADLLKLLSMRLSAAGYRVTAVESAEAALTQIALARPALVVSDVRLPGRDGLALFDEIRARHPALPVILLTAHGTIPDAVDATARGVFSYLTKPFDGKELLDKVAQALAVSAPEVTGGPAGDEAWRAAIVSNSNRMAEAARRGEDGRALGRERADPRRKRHRQGTARRGDPPRQPARAPSLSSPSTAARFPRRCSSRSCSGTSRARSPARSRTTRGLFVRRPTAARCSSTRSATCRRRCRSSCCACCRSARCGRSVRPSRCRSTCACCRPRTATSTPRWRRGSSASDLFYRLNVVTLRLPTLAERREDIPLLAQPLPAQLAEQVRQAH